MDLNHSLNFLTLLRENNNREWFAANKPQYVEARTEFELLINILLPRLKDVDPEIDVFQAKECVFRIFKDTRFSKDKTPYKTNLGAFIAPGGRKSPFAGYYIHVEPGQSFIGGGVYMPQSEQLRAVRTRIFENVDTYKNIINQTSFKKYFPKIYGEKMKTAPRGFDREWPDIDLLRNKHYAVVHNIPDSFWHSANIIDRIVRVFKAQRPFNVFINEAIRKAS